MSSSLPTISLSQFAGIRAALAEDYPLTDVLAQEGVPEWRWPDLERELTVKVAGEPEVFAQYAADLERAEDNLHRPVAPLDDDLGAWVGFLVAYRTGGQALLDAHALRPTDVARLQRRWKQRLDDDANLRQQAEKLTERPPPPPSHIQVTPGALRPFAWTPGASEAQKRSSLEPLLFLSRTEMAEPSPSRPEEPKRAPLPFTGERPPPPAKLALEPSPEMGATARLNDRPREAVTPFEPPPASGPPSAPVVAEPPSGPALSAPAPSSPPVSSSPAPSQPRQPAVRSLEPLAALGMTAPSQGKGSAPATPFAGANPAPQPVVRRLEPSLDMGSTKAINPRRGGLEPLAHLATTAPVGAETPSSDAVPFAGRKAPPSPEVSRSLEPVAGLGATTADPVASWSVEDYGRYCAELDVAGRPATWHRWHVRGETHHDAIAAQWLRRFNGDPTLRQRFAAALQAAMSALRQPR